MIQKIRRKFIRIAIAVLSITIFTIAAVINLSNWINVRGEIQETLTAIAENAGKFGSPAGRKIRPRHVQNTLDESRYFLVGFTRKGEFRIEDTARSSGLTDQEMKTITDLATESGKTSGRIQDYFYLIQQDEETHENRFAVFLNCETRMEGLRRLLLLSLLSCVGGTLVAWLLVLLFSKKAIQPMIRNAIQQKQFITDAGHELKTPLTVISANMDALELETAPNEWTQNTREQLKNMGSLVSELIYLSRLDEDDASLRMEDLNLSVLLRDEAEAFASVAEFQGKTLSLEIEPDLRIHGNAEALKKLVRQLCDNAIRYSPEEDTISLRALRDGHTLRIVEENSLAQSLSDEQLSHLFDRFYRPDASRSRERGGYGIGLSLIRTIAEKHGGAAVAKKTEEGRIAFLCEFPVK